MHPARKKNKEWLAVAPDPHGCRQKAAEPRPYLPEATGSGVDRIHQPLEAVALEMRGIACGELRDPVVQESQSQPGIENLAVAERGF